MTSRPSRRHFLTAASAAVALAPQAVQPAAGHMKAGTAKVNVTPDKARYDVEKQLIDPPQAYHPVHARCLTLHDGARRMAIVTYDFNCLDYATPILRERCEKELGISPAYLLLLATHNHQVPMQIIPSNFDYGEWLAEKIFGAIKEAIAKEDGPVELHFGSGSEYGIRASGAAPTDFEVQVLKVAKGAKTVALLFNQATHPVRGPDPYYGCSSPGYTMDEIEEVFPGSLALYADACGGNQYWIPLGMADKLAECKRRGHDLAKTVAAVAQGRMVEISGALESKLKLMDLPLADPMPYEKALELARGIPMDIGMVPPPAPERYNNWIRALVRHYKEGIPFPRRSSDYPCADGGYLVPKLDKPRKYECRFVECVAGHIGNLQLCAIQGEPCGPIGARIKDVLRQKGPMMMFGYFAERNLYVPTREIVRQDAYQASVIRLQFGSPVGWAPEVEDEMVKRALAMFGEKYYERPA
jgi:hypothetical protein